MFQNVSVFVLMSEEEEDEEDVLLFLKHTKNSFINVVFTHLR